MLPPLSVYVWAVGYDLGPVLRMIKLTPKCPTSSGDQGAQRTGLPARNSARFHLLQPPFAGGINSAVPPTASARSARPPGPSHDSCLPEYEYDHNASTFANRLRRIQYLSAQSKLSKKGIVEDHDPVSALDCRTRVQDLMTQPSAAISDSRMQMQHPICDRKEPQKVCCMHVDIDRNDEKLSETSHCGNDTLPSDDETAHLQSCTTEMPAYPEQTPETCLDMQRTSVPRVVPPQLQADFGFCDTPSRSEIHIPPTSHMQCPIPETAKPPWAYDKKDVHAADHHRQQVPKTGFNKKT